LNNNPNTMRKIITIILTAFTMIIPSMTLKVQAVITKIVILIFEGKMIRRGMNLIEMIRKHGKNNRNHTHKINIPIRKT